MKMFSILNLGSASGTIQSAPPSYKETCHEKLKCKRKHSQIGSMTDLGDILKSANTKSMISMKT